MATNATWTVVFDDKVVIKQSGDAAGTGYTIADDDFFVFHYYCPLCVCGHVFS